MRIFTKSRKDQDDSFVPTDQVLSLNAAQRERLEDEGFIIVQPRVSMMPVTLRDHLAGEESVFLPPTVRYNIVYVNDFYGRKHVAGVCREDN